MAHAGDHRYGRFAAILTASAATFSLLVTVWMLASYRTPDTSSTPADNATATRQYILQRPFDPAGWLALAGSTMGNAPTIPSVARKIIESSQVLGPVDPQVLRARALVALRSGNVSSGLEQVANIATLFPAERGDAFATMKTYVRDPVWEPFIGARLRRGWPEVDDFVAQTCASDTSLADLLTLVQQVTRVQPLRDDVVSCVGNRAIAQNSVPTAYWVWLNASRNVPKSLGNVFNGDFELPAAQRLFDWRLAAGGEYREGFSASIRPDDARSGHGSILSIRFNRRPLRLPIAQQFLALAPGRYSLTYSLRETGVSAPGAVAWTIKCVPPTETPAMSVATTRASTDGWSIRRQEVTIPPSCTGQVLDLEVGTRLQMLQGLQGTVMFDDISIVRI